jgi:hypothetical protein
MKRLPSVIQREQRAMTKARTALADRHYRLDDHHDDRDARHEPPEKLPEDTERCRVMRMMPSGDWTLVATAPINRALEIATRVPTRCIVVSLRTGKQIYDNKREWR